MIKKAIPKAITLTTLVLSHFVFIATPSQALLPVTSNPVSAGDSTTCVIRASDDLYCVGDNTYGQLGNGNQISTSDPQKVIGISGVSAVSVGKTSVCAVTHSGALYCWGDNTFGQLGLGDNEHRKVATLVASLTGVVQVDVGHNFACALMADSLVSCWGNNDYGQLTTFSRLPSNVPLNINGMPVGVTQVSINGVRVCVLATDVYCWGDFEASTFPDETRRWIPTKLPGSTGAKSVQLGLDFGCFTLATGVACWGANDHGQLGSGNRIPSITPAKVSGLSAAKDLVAGDHFACVLDSLGDTYCWGDNQQGQLIVSSKTDQLNRIPTGAPKAANLDAGANNLCLLKLDASVSCYGDTSSGQSGFLLASSSVLKNSKVANVAKIDAGLDTTCALDSIGALTCWGALVPNLVKDQRFIDISVGDASACGVSGEKKVLCWGSNSSGQLGNDSARSSLGASAIAIENVRFVSVSVGLKHACAVSENGLTYCWGDNSRQQLGSVGASSRIPKPVPGIGTAVSVNSGDNHNCALQSVGTAICWGDNSKKQISSSSSTYLSPTEIVAASSVTMLALGPANTCVLEASKELKCFGDNSKKQAPGMVSGSFLSVATGGNTVCAIEVSEIVVCFGASDSLKLQSLNVDTAAPTRMSIDLIKYLAVGSKHVCVVEKTNQLGCWGSNSHGQLTSSFGFPQAFAELKVTVTGTRAIGEKLLAATTGSESKVSYSYLWKRSSSVGGLIANLTTETKSSYSIATNDLGKFFSVEVKQSKWGTTSSGYIGSAPTSIGPAVRLLLKPAPSIIGSAKVGRTVAARVGRWDSGVKHTYQWYRGSSKIKGGTKISLKLTLADAGKQLYVAVTGTKSGLPKVTSKSPKTAKVVR